MQDHSDAWPFKEPVDPLDVPDYYEIIKDPIGKNTVRLNTEFIIPYIFLLSFCCSLKALWSLQVKLIAEESMQLNQEMVSLYRRTTYPFVLLVLIDLIEIIW